ncbi:MAG: protein-ADP-ribose hydrolase [Kiritimatiellae bacterium]|nr:protein-ADP-ribose hydrolase [Kiritimatiellia bacterium]
MTPRGELVEPLIAHLLREMPECRAWEASFPRGDAPARRRFLRALANVRPPAPLDPDFLRLQDALLAAERDERGIVDAAALPPFDPAEPRIALWRGDIVRLRADAIVNAANDALLGCFAPLHDCIDNAIHSAAGLQLRQACAEIVAAHGPGWRAPTGGAEVTGGYNLPARLVLHTVGPVVPDGRPTAAQRAQLASCYRSCLAAAAENGARTVAFCCISTGVFGYPAEEAASVAVATVRDALAAGSPMERVVFDVFSPRDEVLYRAALARPSAP